MKKTALTLNKKQQELLSKILSKVGDLNFKRRIIAMLSYLDIKDEDFILDMGCGEGFYDMIFEKIYNCKVTAVDFDPEIMNMAKKWLKDSNNIKFEIGDICNLRFKKNTFDKIICTEVIEHIEDDKKAVSELFRVLKPGGILAATVPNSNYPFMWDPLNKIREGLGLGHFSGLNGFFGGIWAYDHKRLYSPRSFRSLLEDAGFQVNKVEVLTHFGVPFNHLVLYVGKNLYTKLPVPEDLKNAMEKFEWSKSQEKTRVSLASRVLNTGLSLLKWVDSFNDREFPLETSAMVVSALARKK